MESSARLARGNGPWIPPEVRDDLARGEEARFVAEGRLLSSPHAEDGLDAYAVLTTDRLIIVPAARRAVVAASTGSKLLDVLSDFWTALTSTTDQEPARASLGLTARGRPGLDIPLHDIRDIFLSRAKHTLGFTLALPAPDPRPPWAIYLELPDVPTARLWAEEAQVLRSTAAPRPELSRIYSLYYLRHYFPTPLVRLRGPQSSQRGTLQLGLDGPQLARFLGEELLLPYEAIERVDYAPPTLLRAARLTLESGGRVYKIEPMKRDGAADLEDVAHLLSETFDLRIGSTEGPLRRARLLVLTAAAGGLGDALWDVLSQL